MVQIDLPHILVAPGMAGEQPSLRLHGLGNFLRALTLGFQVKIRMIVQPFHLVLIQVVRTCLITDVRPVSQDSIITGKRDDSFRSPVGEIRMFLHEPVDQRHHIIVSHRHSTVVLDIFVADFALLIHDQFRRIAVAVHIVVVTAVVL